MRAGNTIWRRQFWQLIVVAIRPAILDLDITALEMAGFAQAFAECRNEIRGAGGRAGIEISNHRHRRLLRASRERPRRRSTAEKRDELASVAVGMRVTSHPPHRSVRAAFPHTVPT